MNAVIQVSHPKVCFVFAVDRVSRKTCAVPSLISNHTTVIHIFICASFSSSSSTTEVVLYVYVYVYFEAVKCNRAGSRCEVKVLSDCPHWPIVLLKINVEISTHLHAILEWLLTQLSL